LQNKNKIAVRILAGVIILFTLTLWTSGLRAQVWIPQNSGTDDELRSVWFNSSMEGWTVGHMGTAVFTINSGMNWVPVNISGEDLNDIAFKNPATGLIVGQNGRILRTSNGGIMWNMIMSNVNSDLNTVAFGDNGNAYAAGEQGVILKSTNDGITWVRIDSALFDDKANFNGSAAKGTGFAIFAGDGGVIAATTNSGMNFTFENSGTDRDLRAVFFLNALTGFIGGKENVLLFTSNGGENWIARNSGLDMDSGDAEVNGIFFISSMTGWAVGDHGAIFMTTNAGMTWMPENSQTTEDLNDVFFADANHGWAVGHDGTIRFRGMPNGIEQNHETAANFRLEQNYPNPFNPSTKINYAIAKNSFVSLAVYDIRGLKVKSLVNAQQSPGSYSIEFNASALPSGIYFYKLETNEFTQTRKMILIK
jgi:photosystem II stability/assembly factor-like uncharacterized protein